MLLALLGAGALAAAPASAHVSLTGSTPAAGASLDVAPTAVELTYSDVLLAVGNAVSVTGPAGPVPLDPLQVADRALVQPLPADLAPGEYTVQWRAASGDGHPIEGELVFTSTALAPTSAAPASSPASPSAPSATASASTEQAAAATSGSSAVTDPLGAGSGLPVWVGGALALAGAAAVGLVLLRRGRRPGAHE